MRLKQLLVVMFVVFSAFAALAAGTPQLLNVSVVGEGSTTTVTVRANGAFTHNEYRPTDDLLMIDLAGVSAGKLHLRERTLQVPGVKSYRVIGYTGAGNAQIARVELALVARPDVRINETKDGLVIQVIAASADANAAPANPANNIAQPPAALPQVKPAASAEESSSPTLKPVALKTAAAHGVSGNPMQVRNVAVVRGTDGLQVEVTASGPITGKTLTLTNPDRIVLDVPNAVPPSRPRPVNAGTGEVRGVRIGRFQADPPVTRVVLDLAAAHDFELQEQGNKLILKLRPAAKTEKAPETSVADAKPVNAPEAAVASEPAAVVATQTVSEADKSKADSSTSATVNSVAASERAASEFKSPVVPATAENKPAERAVAALPQTEQASAPKGAEVKSAPETNPTTPTVTATKAEAPAIVAKNVEPEYKGGGQSARDFVVTQPAIQERRGNSPDPEPAPAKLMAANNAPATTHAVAAPAQAAPVQAAPAPAAAPTAQTAQPTPAKPLTTQPAVNFSAEQRQAAPASSTAPRYTGEPISVNLKDVDLKDFFRLIHEISGLNIVLDPSVNGSLTLVLDDVPWDQALDIVLNNNGLARQLEGNVLRIATVDNLRREAEARRKQVEAQALAVEKVTATRFLSYAHASDVLPTIKRMLTSRGEIVADQRTNALIITDIPNVIPPIDSLISQLDRKTQEVEIEARVVSANRNFARDIGMQLGFGTGNNVFAVGGADAAGTSPLIAKGPSAPRYFINGNQQIPLFSNLPAIGPTSAIAFSNATNAYRIDAVLTMAESRGLVKILSRPRVITQNNIQAIVKQGQRVPIVTQAQLAGPPTTAYIEAVLRLTVTPQITAENTIFLNVDIENTTPDFSNKIFGNPVFLTQQATTQVLVTNGGTAVIGGVLQSQNSLSVNQVPLLGSIPVLGNLFKRRGVNTATQELIFFLTPRIVET